MLGCVVRRGGNSNSNSNSYYQTKRFVNLNILRIDIYVYNVCSVDNILFLLRKDLLVE